MTEADVVQSMWYCDICYVFSSSEEVANNLSVWGTGVRQNTQQTWSEYTVQGDVLWACECDSVDIAVDCYVYWFVRVR